MDYSLRDDTSVVVGLGQPGGRELSTMPPACLTSGSTRRVPRLGLGLLSTRLCGTRGLTWALGLVRNKIRPFHRALQKVVSAGAPSVVNLRPSIRLTRRATPHVLRAVVSCGFHPDLQTPKFVNNALCVSHNKSQIHRISTRKEESILQATHRDKAEGCRKFAYLKWPAIFKSLRKT